jgi:class 3 adenylate cyclase
MTDAHSPPRHLSRQPWRLRFRDPDAERAFVVRDAVDALPIVRAGLGQSMAAWVAGWVFAWVQVPQHRVELSAVVGGVMAPFLALAILATYRRAWSHHAQLLATIGNVLAGGCMVTLGLIFREQPVLVLGGLVIVTFFGFVMLRIRTRSAAIAVLMYTVPYQLLLVHHGRVGVLGAGEVPVYSFVIWLAIFCGVIVAGVGELNARQSFAKSLLIEAQQREIEREHARAERLLLNVLPAPIAERLKAHEEVIADGHGAVTVLFADIVGFTPLSQRVTPHDLVEILNRLFTAFDELAARFGVEKIKTIGDAYMVASGLPAPRPDHAEAAADLALAMRAAVQELGGAYDPPLEIRVGLHSGPVVAGVIGKSKFSYDLWGDTVNTAARMESHGVPGEIQVTESTRAELHDAFELDEGGDIGVQGKGPLRTYLMKGRKPASSARAG